MRRAVARWNARDRLLDAQIPERGLGALEAGESGATYLAGPDAPAAAAVSRRTVHREESSGALWGALRRDELELRWDGDAQSLERVLDEWIADARSRREAPADWETALGVRLPARDSEAVLPLLRRGFALTGVLGIRVGRRGSDASAAEARLRDAGCALRRATIADLPRLAELDLELLAHETRYGEISMRPGAAEALAAAIDDRLARDPEWTWILEHEGDAVGCLSLEMDREQHRSQCVEGGPVAYLEAMYLRESMRGRGIGDAVAEFGHGFVEEAGFDRILLDYAALNPRSGPFWHRMGYRPLWFHWQRRPA